MDHPPIAFGARVPAARRGFTAIELMVTIAIMAILAALAAPSYTELIERWRVRNITEAMRSTLYLARSEAIRRGGSIVVAKKAGGAGCALANTNEEWGCGWSVFVDTNKNNAFDAGELVLQDFNGMPGIDAIHKQGGSYFTVDRNGIIGNLNVKGFIFSPNRTGIGSPATRGICVAAGGRVRVIEDVPCQ